MMDAVITIYIALLARAFSAGDSTSELRADAQVLLVPEHEGQCAVSEVAQTRMTRSVIRFPRPRKSSATPGVLSRAAALAAYHSSGSGTARRIHKTKSAGSTPTRNK